MSLVFLQEGVPLAEPRPVPMSRALRGPAQPRPSCAAGRSRAQPHARGPCPRPRLAGPEGAKATRQLSPQTCLLPLNSRTTWPGALMQDPTKLSCLTLGLLASCVPGEQRLGDSPRLKIATRCSVVRAPVSTSALLRALLPGQPGLHPQNSSSCLQAGGGAGLQEDPGAGTPGPCLCRSPRWGVGG